MLNPPLSPTSTLPLDFVHVSFIVVPVIPSPLCPLHSPLAIVRLFLTSMSLVIFCLLFSSVDYVPVKGEGWGGVEGWGEKEYNCNWITIKIKKNLNWFLFKNHIILDYSIRLNKIYYQDLIYIFALKLEKDMYQNFSTGGLLFHVIWFSVCLHFCNKHVGHVSTAILLCFILVHSTDSTPQIQLKFGAALNQASCHFSNGFRWWVALFSNKVFFN